MINLQSIEAENFVIFREIKITPTIKSGVIFIEGENLDIPSLEANGVGKTLAVPDLISWILYETTIRGLKSKEVIGPFGRKTIGKIVFKDGSDIIEITRTCSKSSRSFEIYKNRTFQSAKQEWIDNNIMPWRAFKNTCLMGQDDVDQFVRMTDKNRKEVIKAATGMDMFEPAQELANKKLKELKQKFELEEEKLESKLDLIKYQKEKLKLFKDLHKEQVEKFEKNKQDLLDEIKKKNDFKKLYDKLQKKIKNTREKLDFAIESRKKYSRLYDSIKIAMPIKERRIADDQSSLYYRLEENKEEIAELKQEIDNINDIVGERCDECGVIIKYENIPDVIGSKERKINDLENENKNLRIKIEKSEKRFKILNKNLSKLMAEYKDLVTLSQQEENIHTFNIRRYQDEAVLCKVDFNEIVKLRKKYKDLVKDGISESKKFIDIAKHDISSSKKEIDLLKSSVSKINEEIKIYSFWHEAYGSKGIMAHAMEEIIDNMNDKVEEVLEYIVDGDIEVKFVSGKELKKGGYSSDIDIIIIDKTKKKPIRFVLWSGGEKGRISFAIVMALMQLASNKINLMIIDEAFDKGISQLGVDRILDFIQNINGLVFLISHKSPIRSRFSDIMKIVKQQNGESIVYY